MSLCELFNGRCRGPGPGAPGPVACGTGFGVWAGGPGPGSGARASGSGPGPRARGSGPGDGGPGPGPGAQARARGPGPGPGAWGPGPGACPLHVQFPKLFLLTPRAREKFCQHSTRNQVCERTGTVDTRRTYCLPVNECQKYVRSCDGLRHNSPKVQILLSEYVWKKRSGFCSSPAGPGREAETRPRPRKPKKTFRKPKPGRGNQKTKQNQKTKKQKMVSGAFPVRSGALRCVSKIFPAGFRGGCFFNPYGVLGKARFGI